MCSVCRGIHLHEQHNETNKDSYCGESITLSSVWWGTNLLVPLEEECQQNYIALCSVWHLIHIQPLHDERQEAWHCVINDSSPWTINSDTWRVILGEIYISVLPVTRKSSPGITYRDNVISKQKNHGNTLLNKICNTKMFAAGENW